METQSLLVVHALATWFLTGLIWIVQLVHYPLFGYADRQRFIDFEQEHARRITWIVAPVMGLELLSGAWLAWSVTAQPQRGVLLVGAGLIALSWLSTALVQVPCHARLARGFDAATHRRLVTTNWWRTAASTLRAALVAWLLLDPGPAPG